MASDPQTPFLLHWFAFLLLEGVSLTCFPPTAGAASEARLGSELHFSVCPEDGKVPLQQLGAQGINPERRSLSYYDTDDLRLFRSGVIVRSRRDHGGQPELTVKVRPAVPPESGSEWWENSSFKCEKDTYPGRSQVSCSQDSRLSAEEMKRLMSGSLRKAASDRQKKFLREFSQAGLLEVPLREFGPVEVRYWDFHWENRKFRLEQWAVSPRKVILELSTKAPDGGANTSLLSELSAKLRSKGVQLCEQQGSKTREVLESLAAEPGETSEESQ